MSPRPPLYRYAVAVFFRIKAEIQHQLYFISAETNEDAQFAGTQFADEWCIKNGEPNGALIVSVIAEQIPA